MPPEPLSPGGAVLDALDVALLVAAALDKIGCEYFIGGSVASSLQGEPRATNDIDFVVAMSSWRVPAFAAALGPISKSIRDRSATQLRRAAARTSFIYPSSRRSTSSL